MALSILYRRSEHNFRGPDLHSIYLYVLLTTGVVIVIICMGESVCVCGRGVGQCVCMCVHLKCVTMLIHYHLNFSQVTDLLHESVIQYYICACIKYNFS